jgi:hypothetical protein
LTANLGLVGRSSNESSNRKHLSGKGDELTEHAELVHELNTRIREVGEQLLDEDDYTLDFYCECGCWQMVQLTMSEYDALEGAPVYRAGHPATSSDAPSAG